ncbi:PREDICTED: uncharacterized protein LOC104605243 [Nelumbo nucifera]|uniref:Uncharacterized protein LOC104605243 n=1 Tax=Nelumbo nucifera TaxID=4432 RepID=A0A1U8AYP9_NELNU|nr:PREDICTED: uncharacterized protein LOC104605243 [Nelumbo nucifera]XP_010268231.1 PREDICTED: uncharacterized protein LOC104605243 [Nelumbo nucifera]
MSSFQLTACAPLVNATYISAAHCLTASGLRTSPTYALQLHIKCPKIAFNTSSYQRCTTVCMLGGKGKSGNGNEDSPWKAIENAIRGFGKERSVQDVLRKQMREQEFGDTGGGAGSPPSGGGDGSGGSEDEGFGGILDELLQVTLATIGFIFLYMYIINGEEMTRLATDYLKYIFWRKKSVRLRRSMYKWRRFYRHLTRKDVLQEDWLEREILNTPTWWHNPDQLRQLLRARLASTSYP